MQSKVQRSVLFLFLIGIFLFNHCSDPSNESKDFLPTGGAVKIQLLDPVETLDPLKIILHSDWHISTNIFEGLVGYGDTYDNVEPLIAQSWEVLQNGKKFIFKLRKDIKFHDDPCFPGGKGRNLTSKDILFSFERLASQKSNNVNWGLFIDKIVGINDFNKNISDSISGIKLINDYEIEFNLTKPYYTFLKILASPPAYIIPEEAVVYYGNNFYKHPVGTGPFRLAYWREFSEILLVKNENYWDKTKFGQPLPLVDEIKISLITSQPVAASEFIKGNSNILWVSNSTLTKMKSAQGFTDNYNLYITNSPSSVRFWGFSMNNKTPFANNKYLRWAAAYAYNRNLVIEKAAEDYNIANSLVPEEFLGDAYLEWYTHNIQKANALFNENKHVVYDHDITISAPVDFAATKILEDALSNLGFNINVKIRNLRYYNHIVEDRPDIFRVAMTPSYPDPEEYYSLFYSKSEKFVNLCGYNNPEYDFLFERALIETNKDERRNLFLKLEEILKHDVPLLPMTHSAKNYCIVPKYIKSFGLKNGVPDYKNVWMDIKDDKSN